MAPSTGGSPILPTSSAAPPTTTATTPSTTKPTRPKHVLCAFALDGRCRLTAEECRFSHDEARFAAVPLCPDFMSTTGKGCRKRRCLLVHGDRCEVCELNALHPWNQTQREGHMSGCRRGGSGSASAAAVAPVAAADTDTDTVPNDTATSVDKGKQALLEMDTPVPCSICLEDLRSKDRVGILPNCAHIFCYKCLMEWRSSAKPSSTGATSSSRNGAGASGISPANNKKTVRSCPNCREQSYFAVPSSVIPTSDEHRKEIIEEFKKSRAKIPCKHFLNSNRKHCPFGDACFYAHLDAKGNKVILPKRKRNTNTWRHLRNHPNSLGLLSSMMEQLGIANMLASDELEEYQDFIWDAVADGDDYLVYGSDSDYDDYYDDDDDDDYYDDDDDDDDDDRCDCEYHRALRMRRETGCDCAYGQSLQEAAAPGTATSDRNDGDNKHCSTHDAKAKDDDDDDDDEDDWSDVSDSDEESVD